LRRPGTGRKQAEKHTAVTQFRRGVRGKSSYAILGALKNFSSIISASQATMLRWDGGP
jgi:hypothetical protein